MLCLTKISNICSRTLTSTMTNSAVAAVIQMTCTSEIQRNLEQAGQLVMRAKSRGAEMVFLPEACDFIGENRQQTFGLAQSVDGSTVQSFRKIAAENKVWLSLGGVHTLSQDIPEKTNNTHLIINSSGDIVSSYNKTHLFDVEIPGQVSLKESAYVTPGSEILPPVETPLGPLGLGICYDLRFAEHSQCLVRAGAKILTYPSAFTVKTGMAHWESLLRARAIESQCYVIAAAQTGQHNPKRSSYGHSMIVDPWGVVVAQCGEGVGVATADIDLAYLDKVRVNMPVQQHRRHDLYSEVRPLSDQTCFPEDDFVFKFGPVTVPGAAIFMRSEHSVAFVNKKPVVEGHVLASSNRMVAQVSELSPEKVADLFKLVQRVDKFLQNYFEVNSITISIQNGVLAGQSIPHVHVHILPRREGDFADNDDVYKELQTHDKKSSGWRTEDEMVAEARLFRSKL